ncbi:MAG: sulfotransferase [Hydrogenophilales bacterium]|nr:sulfotransferase [Hydrogenophilales bacterium]
MNTSSQRGYAALQARNVADAVQWFERALAENPGDAQAMSWLGQSLCSLGRRAEGGGHLRQSGRLLLDKSRQSGDINPALEIAQQMQQWGDFPGALELLGQAGTLNGGEFRVFQLLAVTLAQLNKKAEALDAGRRAAAISPANAMMQVLLASLEADAGLNEDARHRLETVLAAQMLPREAFRAHKELARVLDKLKAYNQVFPHLHASARLSATLPEYVQQNLAFLPNMIRTNTAGFDRDLMGRWSGVAFPPELPAPVFLVGFFRSGTTLAQEVLGAHSDVFVADETDFVWAMQRELHQMVGGNESTADKLSTLDQSDILRLRTFYWKRVRDRFGDSLGERRLVDKFTLNTLDLGLINTVFPDAKLIFVMRDPRDVCLSCFMQLMVPSPATAHLLSWHGTADFYAEVMRWWMHIKHRLTMDLIEFRYEDAVGQFEPTFRRVFDALGLAWDDGVRNFHEYAAKKYIASPSRNQVAQPLYASSVARWRHYEAEFAPVAKVLEPFIAAFGYEPF